MMVVMRMMISPKMFLPKMIVVQKTIVVPKMIVVQNMIVMPKMIVTPNMKTTSKKVKNVEDTDDTKVDVDENVLLLAKCYCCRSVADAKNAVPGKNTDTQELNCYLHPFHKPY